MMNHTLTLALPEEVFQPLQVRARAQRLEPGEWVQRALIQVLAETADDPAKDPAFGLSDIAVETGITDLAEYHDHYLYGTPRHSE
jgi:hypothetical protein